MAEALAFERIYLGGLDPPQLTAKHVIDRFKHLNVEIQGVEDHPGKSFCHLTARSTSQESSETALEILASKYHNVRWKGCRLQIQAARPHFLQRLEEERKQRQEDRDKELTSQQRQSQESHPTVLEKDETIKSSVPRRLRIRRKFGDEAFHVDTKPWLVDDWSSFSRASGKQRKLEEKDKERRQRKNDKRQDTSIAPRPRMHRAIHIRFGSDDVDAPDASMQDLEGEQSKNSYDEDALESISGSSSESSIEDEGSDDHMTAESERISGEQLEKAQAANNDAYTWSDDSSSGDNDDGGDDNDDSDDSICDEPTKETYDNFASTKESATDDSHSARDDNSRETRSEESSIEEGFDIAPEQKGANNVSQSKSVSQKGKEEEEGYQWSSSEDESSEDDAEYIRKLSRPFRQVSEADDFAAGLDLDQLDASNDESEDGKRDDEVLRDPMDVDISNDVSTNLNILSDIFPDMKVKQMGPDTSSENDCNDAKVKENEDRMTRKSGFTENGIMLRFDPSAASAQQFEIDQPKKEKSTSESEQSNVDVQINDQDEDSLERKNMMSDENGPEGVDDKSNIYEQDKLEDVFREARSAWSGATTTDGTTNTSGFSFGFDLGADLRQEVAETPIKVDAEKLEEHQDAQPCPDAKIPEKRIKGFGLPSSMVQKYKALFFKANNGAVIAQDVDAFRNDPKVREEWNKERHRLTQDWKRKRKHALTRIQKRMKIR